MPPRRPPQTFQAAFEGCLANRTGIVINDAGVRYDEMAQDLDRALRLGGFAGDEGPGNEALQALGAQEKEMSSDLNGPDGLLSMVEKLGPLNSNLTSESFIKPFFSHLNLSGLNIVTFGADVTKFTGLTNLDVSRNNLSTVDIMSPNLKFLNAYNNKINQITCAKQPSLRFLGAGYNMLANAGMAQVVQRFRSLLSLDLGYNNLISLRQFLDDAKALDRLKQLCVAGNPLCLLPYYRLVIVKNLPQLQLLDEQAIGEAEAADAQLVDQSHLEVPPNLNVVISFGQVAFLKRLLIPMARELPATRMESQEKEKNVWEDVEVPVTEEENLLTVARKGKLFFKLELPAGCSDEAWVDTTDIEIEAPPEAEDPKAKGKAAPKKGEEEPPPKPPGEPIDLSSLKWALPVRPRSPPAVAAEAEAAEAAEAAEGEAVEAEAPPTEAPLLFPLSIATLDGSDASENLLQLRDWLQVGMRVKALYRKTPEPVEADASPAGGADADDQGRVATPLVEEPRLIGGGVLSLRSALWPLVSPVSEEMRQGGTLPPLPPTFSIGPTALTLAPYSKWLEPDVQVPDAPASKSLSDVSASVTMDVLLYGREPEPEDEAGGKLP